MQNIFTPADILLPKEPYRERFAVVACDQYTSEPDYWRAVDKLVDSAPSALRLIVPESALGEGDVQQRIAGACASMRDYLQSAVFDEAVQSFLYIERTLRAGAVRRGIIGKLDLTQYDYHKGSHSPVRATEATVLERIPPRVAVREHAALESPHVLVLIDDPADRVLTAARRAKEGGEKLYDFPLMMESGAVAGWRIPDGAATELSAALDALFESGGDDPLVFAVGDGNHSLASAKEHFERVRARLGNEAALCHPARWALVEVVNVHEPSLLFEPIHRVVFGIDREAFIGRMNAAFAGDSRTQRVELVRDGLHEPWTIGTPTAGLPVGSLQNFIDGTIARHGGTCDYIHGAEVVDKLSHDPHALGFLLPAIDKSALFRTVRLDGALTRKTFSMGEACDKRFYFECRRITPAR